MPRKAVSLTRYERQTIARKVKEKYEKICEVRHPDPTFFSDLSKELYLQSAEELAPHLDEVSVKYIDYTSDLSFHITRSKLTSDLAIVTLNTNKPKLLDQTSHLEEFGITQDELPEIYKTYIHNKPDILPITFKEGTTSRYDVFFTLTEEQKERVEEYNAKMVETYEELGNQLNILLNTIESCKSTKMFEAKLPDLVSLYPQSVLKKLEEKNGDTSPDLTEEERTLRAATASLAAASVLDN